MSRPDAVRAVWGLLERTDDAAIITDCIGSLLLRDPVERQGFLEQTAVADRLEAVVTAMVELIAHQGGTPGA